MMHPHLVMRSAWLILTLSLALTGCFDTHGRADGGAPPPPDDARVVLPPPPPPPIDAGPGVCRDLSAFVETIRCLAPDDPSGAAGVEVTSVPLACCDSGAVSARARRTGDRSFDVSLRWTACECCDECECLGPYDVTYLDLGALEPGVYTITAESASCELLVPERRECAPSPSELRMPRHVMAGQSIGATMTQRGAFGCACDPRANVSRGPGHLDVRMELCDCCDACDCIDPGYQTSAVIAHYPVGTYELLFHAGAGQLTVHDPRICGEAEALSLEIVGPADDLIVTGPRLYWAHVTGQDWLCCASPAGVLDELPPTGSDISLTLRDCVMSDCDCEPTAPTGFDAWYAIGELPPGEHTVRVGSLSETFSVP